MIGGILTRYVPGHSIKIIDLIPPNVFYNLQTVLISKDLITIKSEKGEKYFAN